MGNQHTLEVAKPTLKDWEKVLREEGGVATKAGKRFRLKPSTTLSWVKNNSEVRDLTDKVKAELQAAKKSAATAAAAPALDEPVSREELLERRVKDLEKQVKSERRLQVMDAELLIRFDAAFGKANQRYSPLVIKKSDRIKEKHEQILLFSDTHANEVVSEEETMGLNGYNWDIMLKRMEAIRHSVLSFQENRPYPISKLHIPMLGDMLSGDIHQELTITNEKPNEQAVVDFAHDTCAWIEEFQPHYEDIFINGVPGNHPRKTQKPTAKQVFNNSDWTYYQFLKARLDNNKGLHFNFQKAKYSEMMVGGGRWRMILMHGDGIKSSMVDVPWGGIIRFMGKLSRTFAAAGRPVDFFVLGHWHTANAIEAGGPDSKVFVNGSIKGVDEYSLQRFGGGSSPCQLLLTVHPRRGITDVSYLDPEPKLPLAERYAAAA